MELTGKVAIVTGASMGIGEATARELVQGGARVAMAARSAELLARIAGELNASPGPAPGLRALAVPTDVSDRQAIQRMVSQVLETWGQVDILVNNAGVSMYAALADSSIEQQRYITDVNYWGAMHCIEAVLPHMLAQGTGTIANLASIEGKHAVPYQGAYCATKAALNIMSDVLRLELAPAGVRVITIVAGVTASRFQENAIQEGAVPPPRVLAGGTQAAQAARAIVNAIRRGGPPEVYVTLFDRMYVTFATLFPGLTDRILMFVAGRRRLSTRNAKDGEAR